MIQSDTNSPEPTIRYTGKFVRTDRDDALEAPLAEAMLVRDGKIVAIGPDSEVDHPNGVPQRDLGEGWVLPGLIEAHGHPSVAATFTSDFVTDIRPVVVKTADEAMERLQGALSESIDGVLANGWDPLLQRGLTNPRSGDLDRLAGEIPLVIVHNSGHSAFFNTAAARAAGVSRDTPDPAGAKFERDSAGDLTGVAFETAAIEMITAPAMNRAEAELPRIFANHLTALRKIGITTVSDLSWDHALDPLVFALQSQGQLAVRLRTYEMSRPGGVPSLPLNNGDEWFRQVGVKTWSDGSPWVGNIATSFPYLDTPATRAIGLEPGHRGTVNYSAQQLVEIGAQYAESGWQLACHAHGDLAVDQTFDAYEELIMKFKLADHRFRLEHVGAMTPTQFSRALALGVTVSLFVDHITYWGDVLIDDLFGERHGAAWADAGGAFSAGHRATFHNDGWVTPNEPLRNMAVAETRTSQTGRLLGGGSRARRQDTLRAHTSNAAWQLFSEHEIGALAPGLFADFTIINVDPRIADPESLAEADVLGSAVNGAYLEN